MKASTYRETFNSIKTNVIDELQSLVCKAKDYKINFPTIEIEGKRIWGIKYSEQYHMMYFIDETAQTTLLETLSTSSLIDILSIVE